MQLDLLFKLPFVDNRFKKHFTVNWIQFFYKALLPSHTVIKFECRCNMLAAYQRSPMMTNKNLDTANFN